MWGQPRRRNVEHRTAVVLLIPRQVTTRPATEGHLWSVSLRPCTYSPVFALANTLI